MLWSYDLMLKNHAPSSLRVSSDGEVLSWFGAASVFVDKPSNLMDWLASISCTGTCISSSKWRWKSCGPVRSNPSRILSAEDRITAPVCINHDKSTAEAADQRVGSGAAVDGVVTGVHGHGSVVSAALVGTGEVSD